MNVTTIVLINGLWMTALSWELWVQHYTDKGYCVIAANWPSMEGDIQQLRRDPLGLSNVVDHYEKIIRELESPPIIIGFGSGGLVTQILLYQFKETPPAEEQAIVKKVREYMDTGIACKDEDRTGLIGLRDANF